MRESLIVLDARSGAVLTTYTEALPAAPSAVDARDGRVLALTAATGAHDPSLALTTVLLLDGTTGRILGSLSTGAADVPRELVMEGTTGRALLLENPGFRQASDPWGWARRLPWLPLPAPPAPQNARTGSLVILDVSA